MYIGRVIVFVTKYFKLSYTDGFGCGGFIPSFFARFFKSTDLYDSDMNNVIVMATARPKRMTHCVQRQSLASTT
jgi:hypothetical protein